MQLEVIHRPEDGRYVILADGEPAGYAIYRDRGGEVEIPYTEVSPRFGGQGVGSALVRGVLEDLQGRDVTVVPTCSFVADFMRRNAEFEGLLTPDLAGRFGRGPDAARTTT